MARDTRLDTLLNLDSETIWVEHHCRVKFEAKLVEPTEHKPHGISYSLTLHAKDGNVYLVWITHIEQWMEERTIKHGWLHMTTFIQMVEGKARLTGLSRQKS